MLSRFVALSILVIAAGYPAHANFVKSTDKGFVSRVRTIVPLKPEEAWFRSAMIGLQFQNIKDYFCWSDSDLFVVHDSSKSFHPTTGCTCEKYEPLDDGVSSLLLQEGPSEWFGVQASEWVIVGTVRLDPLPKDPGAYIMRLKFNPIGKNSTQIAWEYTVTPNREKLPAGIQSLVDAQLTEKARWLSEQLLKPPATVNELPANRTQFCAAMILR